MSQQQTLQFKVRKSSRLYGKAVPGYTGRSSAPPVQVFTAVPLAPDSNVLKEQTVRDENRPVNSTKPEQKIKPEKITKHAATKSVRPQTVVEVKIQSCESADLKAESDVPAERKENRVANGQQDRKEGSSLLGPRKAPATQVLQKSPGKRLCLEPPASPTSVSPAKRKCPEERAPLTPLTPTKSTTPLQHPSPVRVLFSSPSKTALLSPCKTPTRRALFSPAKNLPAKSPAKIIRPPKSPFKSPYKQPRVIANPAASTPEPVCRKKLLQKKLSAGRASSSPALKTAKRLLQSSAPPDRLIGREAEVSRLEDFLSSHVTECRPGSLYVSGAPGTGKSASLSHILQRLKKELSFTLLDINCMSHNSNTALFSDIAAQLRCTKSTKAACQSFITAKNKKKMIVMLLDEVDQLETRDNCALYTLFEWPSLPNSRLVLIGIANALDLTERQLPRLRASVTCQPELLHFPPYGRDQIMEILKHRLREIPDVGTVMDGGAIQFCARKISVITGDIRKALDICRRAIELVEVRGGGRVTIPFISRVIQEVYGGQVQNQLAGPAGSESTLPLQQQLLLCSVAIATTGKRQGERNSETVLFGRLHAILSKVCADRMLGCPDFSEFVDMSGMLESRGLVSIKRHKEKRQQAVSLRIQPKELEQVLEDRTLLATIMDNAAKFV